MAEISKLEKVILEGTRVRLEPLMPTHLPALAQAIEDGALWTIPVTFVPRPDDLEGFFSFAEQAFHAGRELVFATIDKATGKVAGSTRFRCIDLSHRRAEIGFTFLGRSWQRTHINTEAKYLMLQHAFESGGLNRVELLTDVLNHQSRRAIARIGAKEEGILRSHMVMRDGRIRDSVMFSIVRAEWPAVKAVLGKRIHQAKPDSILGQ
jgi:RimJ/RimL family protein N-acetyltransferase